MASICVFGDSIGRGVVFDGESNRYSILNDCFTGILERLSGMKVKNLASFGSTVCRGVKIVDKHLDELRQYDRVILEFGGNDCDFNWDEVSRKPDEPHEPKTPVAAFERKYLDIVWNILKAGGKPLLLTLPPIDAQRYFARISQGLNPKNILAWLGDKEHIYRWHEMYNLAVCRIAVKTGAPLADVRSAFLEKKDCLSLICDDGIHPNENGHKVIYQAVQEALSGQNPSA